MTFPNTPVDVEALTEWLGLSASVIKSGEPWTATCEQTHSRAAASLSRLLAERREMLEALRPFVEAIDGIEGATGHAALVIGRGRISEDHFRKARAILSASSEDKGE